MTPDEDLTLQQAAERLGVHYMTAYRYVRLGMLPAAKVGATWQVKTRDVERFRQGRDIVGPTTRRTPGSAAPWAARLESRLVAGDVVGAWSVVEAALAAGAEVAQIYLEVITPAMVSIGRRWADGELDVADEHRASAVVSRVLSRLGPRLARPGRTRGSVVLGGAPGDHHGLPVAMLADLLTGAGFEVIDLGADVPAASLATMAGKAQRLVAVGISVSAPDLDAHVRVSVDAAHAARPGVPVLVGGGAVRDDDHARVLHADAWAADGPSALALIESLVEPASR